MATDLSLPIPDELVEALARRVAELVADGLSSGQRSPTSPWLDVAGDASYAIMTEQAIRDADKRGQLKSYRTNTGRVRFRVEDLDAFLRGSG
jgi:hypothetical protein